MTITVHIEVETEKAFEEDEVATPEQVAFAVAYALVGQGFSVRDSNGQIVGSGTFNDAKLATAEARANLDEQRRADADEDLMDAIQDCVEDPFDELLQELVKEALTAR